MPVMILCGFWLRLASQVEKTVIPQSRQNKSSHESRTWHGSFIAGSTNIPVRSSSSISMWDEWARICTNTKYTSMLCIGITFWNTRIVSKDSLQYITIGVPLCGYKGNAIWILECTFQNVYHFGRSKEKNCYKSTGTSRFPWLTLHLLHFAPHNA